MNKHLYGLKKQCPAIKHDIELTDNIKQHILNNRIYNVTKQPTQQQVINQQINNYQIIINYINKKDFQEKLNQYLEYTNDELLDYYENIESKYKKQKNKLETNTRVFCKEDTLNLDSFLKVLHNCTSTNHVKEMNIMYDKVLHRLHIYEGYCGEWNGQIFETGVKELIEKIQDVYLDYYEEYLLNQYVTASVYDKQCIREALKEYYEFLECFEVNPRIITSTDEFIQDIREGDIKKLYNNVKDELKASKSNQVKKLVYNVIKTNCNASIIELNKKMMELIKMDETFKIKILDELQNATAI